MFPSKRNLQLPCFIAGAILINKIREAASFVLNPRCVFFFLFDDINVLFRKSLGDLGLETYEGLRTGFTSQRTFDDVVKLLSKDVGAELLIVHVKNCTSRLRS